MKSILNKFIPIVSSFKVIWKLLYFLIFITLPVFALCYWKFQYVDKIIEFLKISWWPIVSLFIIFLFKKEIGNLIDEVRELNILGSWAKRGENPPTQESQSNEELDVFQEYKQINEQYRTIISSLGNNVDTLKNQIATKEIELDLERIYNVIFGSQISILKYLTTANLVGLDDLVKYYETVQRKNSVLQNWGIDQYLSFLISSKLIEPTTSGGFQVAPKGRLFIRYIEEIRKYNLNKNL